MNTKLILAFLRDVAANNNREWFHAHKEQYDAAKSEFDRGVEELITALSRFDTEISHLKVKDCTYRFYRDTRFSQDKSPYKRHFGAYICAKGKKSLRGGYYLHIQPGNCFLATGSYWLPTNILTSCRNEIMANIDQWREAVENGKFIKYFGYPNAADMGDYTDDEQMPPKGFGISHLKKAPKEFPKDYEFIDYLRMKDYCCWHSVDEAFFASARWASDATKIFEIAKPMMDLINSVIDDYE